ncbi:putative T-lymphocyte surface antigen Ly-9-like [Triplophysa rosa]|uniref:T-lymphocyte surface antigen Ly-9-like n=1 Tax=Triplophysa rosa TaxID=992332 RepID=A0A9W8CBY5_TRIRA|nr:putative T-lymphocyte surface antigen Ly-9-like [Triplophysa rosa]
MNAIQKICSIFEVLLFLLQQESCAEKKPEIVHKAVGSSLHLITDHPKENLTQVEWKFCQKTFAEYDRSIFSLLIPDLFDGRLHTNESDVSVTVKNLQLSDSGNFQIVQEGNRIQYGTKEIQLHVHDPIGDVNIQNNVSWLQSKNICTFHLHCLVLGSVNASFNWSGYQVGNGPHLSFNLTAEARATLNCTANNSVSVKYMTQTVMCKKENGSNVTSGIPQDLLLIAGGAGIVGIAMIIGIIGACYKWRNLKDGQMEEVWVEGVEQARSRELEQCDKGDTKVEMKEGGAKADH